MIKLYKKILFAALICCLPVCSFAWGMLGHRVVGQIAESYLTAKTRLALQKIMGHESLAMAANWADFIKSDPAYSYLSPWHYVDFKTGASKADVFAYLKQDTIADAYTKLSFIISELKNKNLPHYKQLLYVRMLIHILGDIHQPFHAGQAEDKGGNDIKVLWGYEPNPTNMHSVWDTKLIESQSLSYTEYARAINFTTAKQRAEWQKTSIAQWLYESNQIAQGLYAEIKEPNQKINSYRYIYDHIHTADEQMLKAGVRLAGILNMIFGA